MSRISNIATPSEIAELTRPTKRSKYGNVRVEVDGLRFDSIGEARRWQELQLLEKAGEITELTRQVRYDIPMPDLHDVLQTVCSYIADFTYRTKDGRKVVEDHKGGNATKTPLYRLKKRLMKLAFGIDILETGK